MGGGEKGSIPGSKGYGRQVYILHFCCFFDPPKKIQISHFHFFFLCRSFLINFHRKFWFAKPKKMYHEYLNNRLRPTNVQMVILWHYWVRPNRSKKSSQKNCESQYFCSNCRTSIANLGQISKMTWGEFFFPQPHLAEFWICWRCTMRFFNKARGDHDITYVLFGSM